MPKGPRFPSANEGLQSFAATRLTLSRMRVRGGASLKKLVGELTARVAKALDVARVGVWFLVEDGAKLSVYHVHARGEETPFEGALLASSSFPGYFTALAGRAVIDADDVDADPRTIELRDAYTRPLGITSMLDAPIMLGGEVIGVVCHEHIGPKRNWTQAERDFARSVADLIAVKLAESQKAEAETALSGLQVHLDEMRSMNRLGRAAGGLAHDLRNLLNLVMGAAGLIAESPEATQDIKELADDILRAVDRWRSLAQDLVELGSNNPTAPQPIAVGTHVARFALSVGRGLLSDRTLEVHTPEEVGRVMIDPRQLDRVVLNLLVNAREATGEGERIAVTVDKATVSEPGGIDGRYVLVQVDDAGEGMDPETRARIFEPYYSTRTNDSTPRGLGLAIVYEIVGAAGGFIHVDSERGKGTSVRVYLPRIA